MKNENLFLFAAVGLGVFVMSRYLQSKTRNTGSGTAASALAPWVSQVASDNGWKYFSDGTSIGPDGTYYKGADVIYNPAGMYANP